MIAISLHHSYILMERCWEMEPENRPTFEKIYNDITAYLERESGYLEMSLTTVEPNRAAVEEVGGEGVNAAEEDIEVSSITSEGSGAQYVK